MVAFRVMIAVLLLLFRPAAAACVDPYTKDEVIRDLSISSDALRNLDEGTFRAAAQRIENGILCLPEAAPPQVYATAYRIIGAGHFLGGDEEEARRWFRTALELDPLFQWDIGELSSQHPLRVAFEDARFVAQAVPEPVGEGLVLVPPEGTWLALDGREMLAPEATVDRPHVLMVVDRASSEVREAVLIESNEIPASYVMDERTYQRMVEDRQKTARSGREPAVRDRVTNKVEEQEGAYKVVEMGRVRPALKTPLMLVGGAGVVGSGVLYALSFGARSNFDAATTKAEVYQYRDSTNTLVIASGATLVAGLGIGYTGVLLDGTPGIGFRARF